MTDRYENIRKALERGPTPGSTATLRSLATRDWQAEGKENDDA